MVLATAGASGPWAAPVFYALDDTARLGLLFVSNAASRHGGDLASQGAAAAAIAAQHEQWRTIRGVQLEGEVEALAGEARLEALNLLVERFPWLTDMAASADEQERRIAARLTESTVYRLHPWRAVLIDNEREFGSREELVIRPAGPTASA
jgi:uncharacterized protein YhbP (UPF0306 family)